MKYEGALAYISSLAPRGWRLGLDRMFEFARRAALHDVLGGGEKSPKYIHVAGTNGKGSVTAFVQSMLTAAGYRTGGFFSPFVYDPRERVQFRCSLIPKAKLADITAMLIPITESLSKTRYGEVSEFEFKVALGLQFWKAMDCDWVALEVGLGGRLDATNIVGPRASAITSISMDHTSILGDSLGEIAFEKAGIIKPDVPVVVGDLPPEALAVVARVARDCGAPISSCTAGLERDGNGYRVTTPKRAIGGLAPAIAGSHMASNMSLAIHAVDAAGAEIDDDSIRAGVAQMRLPGRFERRTWCGLDIVFDGAHNEEAARALAGTLRSVFAGRQVILVTGMLSGHDARSFYRPFAGLVRRAHFVPIDSPRARGAQELAEENRGLFGDPIAHQTILEGMQAARCDAKEGDGLIVVAGSFYLLSGAARCLTACSARPPRRP